MKWRLQYAAVLVGLFLVIPHYVQAEYGPESPALSFLLWQDYLKKFPDLPPSRKCMPEDAKGVWTETELLEAPPGDLSKKKEEEGGRQIAFGKQYNRFVSLWSKKPHSAEWFYQQEASATQQFILTAEGMLYVYERGKVVEQSPCFITTAINQKYPESGLLVLANHAESTTSYSMTLFSPAEN